MKGRIRRITRERKEGRADAVVQTAWLSIGKTERSWGGGTWISKEGPSSASGDESPVLLMLGADIEANAKLVRSAANAARIYLLVGPDTDLQGSQASNVLARRIPEVPATAAYSSTSSRVWIGGGFSLRLDGQQGEALRQIFLRLFWHEATEEAWLDGRQLVWRPARERPFDVPEVHAAAKIRWESPDARLGHELRGARVYLGAGEPPAVAPRRLWCRVGADHHDQLARLAQSGTEVIWDDLELPDLAVGGSSGEVLLAGTRGRLRILLTAAQSQEAGALLDGDPRWRFRANVCIGDPALRRSSFWLAGQVEAHTLIEEQGIEISDVSAASLRDVETTEPSSWPAPEPLALSTRYRWSVVPPRIPAGAEEDQLAKRWRGLDDNWRKRLTAVREVLKNSDGERSRLGKTFSRLLSGLLGFERTHRELLNEVSALEAERLSKAGPSGASTLLSRVDKLEEAAKKHQGDLEDAERKAREEEEREKQNAEWMAQVERARKGAEHAREELEREMKREEALTAEASDIDVRSTNATQEETKDLEAHRKRNSDERKLNEKSLKKLRYDVKRHEEDAARPFTFTPAKIEKRNPRPQDKRFVPTSAGVRSSSDVPEDALPDVGSLRICKGQRYLVIESWEHLDAGEQAAARLSARLVAPEDA